MGYFLPFYPPNSPKNQNFKKQWKEHLEISSFYICIPKIMIRWCMVPEIWCASDGWMDERMEKATYRCGYPPKKCLEILSFYTYMCNINKDHMIYGSWNKRSNFLSHFLAFQVFDNLENENFNIEKKHLEILSFYTCVPSMTIIWCIVPEICSVTDRIVCHFGPFFALLSP